MLFVNFLSYFAVKYVQQLEEISKSSKYFLGYILKGQKALNDRMKLENDNKATRSWTFSTQEGLALVTALSTRWWITKWLKNKKTNKPAYERPITVLFLLQLLLLVKFSLFCVVVFFYGGVMGCDEQVTNWHYFIQSSFALHSLHFELSRISLSVSLDSLLYYLFLRQSLITVSCSWFPDALFIVRKTSPETLLAELGGSDWLVIGFMGGEAE